MTAPESRGIARFEKERDQFQGLCELFKGSDDPEMRHASILGKLLSEARGRIVRAYEEGEPFVAAHYPTAPEIAEELCEELLGWAVERDANCIVTVCPLCQANLDLLNLNGRNMPILYFTQLIGLALGCDRDELGLQHGFAEVPA